jgi:hypothetical protein
MLTSAAVMGFVCAQGTGDDGEWPIKDLRVPLDSYESGKIKTQILAEAARVPDRGPVDAKGVRVEFFTEEGELDYVVLAERCTYDREAGRVTSETRVRIEQEGLLVTGIGFTWSAEHEVVSLKRDVHVEFDRSVKKKLVKNGKQEE